MENEFTAVMANQSDRQLIAIVTTERRKYQQPALEAAELEIARRGITDEQRQAFQAENLLDLQKEFEFETRQVDRGIRFVHLLVDSIVILVLFIVALIVLFMAGLHVEDDSLVPLGVYVFVFLGYYICMECAWQQTLGKMITKTKVVTMNDEVPTNADIIARTLCRFIPFDRLSYLFTANGFHDSISKTSVIRK